MDKDYMIECKVSSAQATAKPVFGGARLAFNTRATDPMESGLELMVSPETGASFTTDFDVTLMSNGSKSY